MSFPDYANKSREQQRAERMEGLLFVAGIFLYVIGIGPALKLFLTITEAN